ncbi:MAG: FAD:protein FMN transferase [Planctomycetaceae bacterium]|nr:FAD:protein FMN transferase [Planctomycetaceae bacterium]
MTSDSDLNPQNPNEPTEGELDGNASSRREFLRGFSAIDAIRRESAKALDEASVKADANKILQNRQSGYLEYYSKNAMACEFEIYFNLHQYKHSGMATMEAFQLIDLLEDQLTIYRDHSELSQINRVAFEENVVVEDRLFQLLSLAKTIFIETEGAFDITSGPLTRLWGFEKRKGNLPAQNQIQEMLPSIGSDQFQLNSEDSTIRFASRDLMLNLGGIGKGHALDRVRELFSSRELNNYVVHGGQSSVIANGNSTEFDGESSTSPSDHQEASQLGWTVGISHPTLPGQRFAEVYLHNQALGTSGSARQGFYHQGKKFGHIIDPRTGWPADKYLSTTVISESAAISDALATAFFVMPLDTIQTYCDRNPEISTILVAENPNVRGQLKIETFNLPDENWKQLT